MQIILLKNCTARAQRSVLPQSSAVKSRDANHQNTLGLNSLRSSKFLKILTSSVEVLLDKSSQTVRRYTVNRNDIADVSGECSRDC